MPLSPKMAANSNSNHLLFPYLHSTSTSTASAQAAAPASPYTHTYAHAHAHQVVHSFDYLYQHLNQLPISLSHHHQATWSPASTYQTQNQPQSYQIHPLKSSHDNSPHGLNDALAFFGSPNSHSNQILHQPSSVLQTTHYPLPHEEQQQQQPEPLQQRPGQQLAETLPPQSASPSPTNTAPPSLTPPDGSLASTIAAPPPAAAPTASSLKSNTGPSEFVKKLYKMLDEPSSNSIVSWGVSKTTVVVKDQSKFQTEVLPKHFKHSNFASFVRQLNKYDFRKVKLSPEGDQQQQQQEQQDGNGTPGSLRWEFYHPHFRADTLAELDHIKRKPPASRPRALDGAGAGAGDGLGATELPEDVRRLAAQQETTAAALGTLAEECRTLKAELAKARRCLDAQQRQIDLLRRPLRPVAGHLSPGWSLSAGPNGAPHDSYGWTVPPRVLVVEDDQVCRRISTTILELVGCRIETAADGLKAVSKMRDGNCAPFDLVLMDILMPNMDGLLATSLIRKFDLMTPIISMTSNSAPVDVVRYIDIGMNDCLPKPFTKEGLLVMLKKHLFKTTLNRKNETDYSSPALHSQHQYPHQPSLLPDHPMVREVGQAKRKAMVGEEEEGSARFEVDVLDEGDEFTRVGGMRKGDDNRESVCSEWNQRASDSLCCSPGSGGGEDRNSNINMKRRRI